MLYHLIFSLCLHGAPPCLPALVDDPPGTKGYATEAACRADAPRMMRKAALHLPDSWMLGGYVCTNKLVSTDADDL